MVVVGLGQQAVIAIASAVARAVVFVVTVGIVVAIVAVIVRQQVVPASVVSAAVVSATSAVVPAAGLLVVVGLVVIGLGQETVTAIAGTVARAVAVTVAVVIVAVVVAVVGAVIPAVLVRQQHVAAGELLSGEQIGLRVGKCQRGHGRGKGRADAKGDGLQFVIHSNPPLSPSGGCQGLPPQRSRIAAPNSLTKKALPPSALNRAGCSLAQCFDNMPILLLQQPPAASIAA